MILSELTNHFSLYIYTYICKAFAFTFNTFRRSVIEKAIDMENNIKHKNHANIFCYICGEFVILKQRRPITETVKLIYSRYFGFEIHAGIDVQYAPNICCENCYRRLLHWFNGTSKSMPFGVPMLWAPPLEHNEDSCYFCAVDITGHNLKTKSIINYPNLYTAIRPRPHSEITPVPTRETRDVSVTSLSQQKWSDPSCSFHRDPIYEPSETINCNHIPFNNDTFQHFVKVTGLSKTKAEIAASMLRDHNLLDKSVLTSVRRRSHELQCFYSMADNFVFCNDISGLMEAMNITYDISEWRMFIDSSKVSLKVALINKGKILPTIPIAYSVQMKETYETLKTILQKIKYSENNWFVLGDFKVINLLLGMQLGFTKYGCFICEWNSRDREKHYTDYLWPERQRDDIGSKNVILQALVPKEKIILPPLHIKLGIVKNFIKAMDRDGQGFQYLKNIFPWISDAKIKEGILIGPNIRTLMNDVIFEGKLNERERKAWICIKSVISNFLGVHKASNYKEIVKDMITAFADLRVLMSLKIHMLHNHIDFFPDNLGEVSDEHGEKFHQEMLTMESRYKGKELTAMLAEYCWSVAPDNLDESYSRRSNRHKKYVK